MKPTKEELKILISDFYDIPGNGCGGILHIVLEDSNTERHFVEWCLEYAALRNDVEGVKLAQILLMFEEDELNEVLGFHDYDEDYE